MQIINIAYILYIVRSAIYQWKWWNDIEIKNFKRFKRNEWLYKTTLARNLSVRDIGDTVWLSVQTNSHAQRSPQTLIY